MKSKDSHMVLKVCGMRDIENIKDVHNADVTIMGFIFFEKSKRFVSPEIRAELFRQIPVDVKKVGVFVNESIEYVLRIIEEFKLEYVQLHGEESPEYCGIIQEQAKVIKAFSVDEQFDFQLTKKYQSCEYLLFDAKGKERGGNGVQYNWEILHNYTYETMFLLSGGIGPDDAERILKIDHPQFAGIDINSGFESAPAMKDIEKIKSFLSKLKCNTQ